MTRCSCGALELETHAPGTLECLACGHRLDAHADYPAESQCADWHSTLPDTPCRECGCTWAEEPGRSSWPT